MLCLVRCRLTNWCDSDIFRVYLACCVIFGLEDFRKCFCLCFGAFVYSCALLMFWRAKLEAWKWRLRESRGALTFDKFTENRVLWHMSSWTSKDRGESGLSSRGSHLFNWGYRFSATVVWKRPILHWVEWEPEYVLCYVNVNVKNSEFLTYWVNNWILKVKIAMNCHT